MQKIVLIFLAGGLGTLARYSLGGLVQRFAGADFPWGTVAVNLLGCFVFGLVWALSAERMIISVETRTVMLVGFMGAFTTFSTFVSESSQMLIDSQHLAAAGNMLGQNFLGIAVFLLGRELGGMF